MNFLIIYRYGIKKHEINLLNRKQLLIKIENIFFKYGLNKETLFDIYSEILLKINLIHFKTNITNTFEKSLYEIYKIVV